MTHRQYLKELFKLIESKSYTVDIECEGEPITKDEALTQVDECVIYVIDKEGYSNGWIHWTFWNDWDESIVDYTVKLDDLINLDSFMSLYNN
jgi:hypothetical protein